MDDRLRTITEAALAAGIARTTIQRWLAQKRIEKRQGGLVSLDDVQVCLSARRTGRPCGRRALGNSLQDRLAEIFLGAEGLRRLRNVLKILAFEWAYRGKRKQFNAAVADALPNGARGEEYRDWERKQKGE